MILFGKDPLNDDHFYPFLLPMRKSKVKETEKRKSVNCTANVNHDHN